MQLYVTPDSCVEGHAHIIWQTVQQGCTTWLLVPDTINCTAVLVYVTPDNSLHCVAWRACWALPTLYPGRQHSGDASHGSRHQCCNMRCTAVLVYVAPDSCVAWRVCPHYILADSTAEMHHHMVPDTSFAICFARGEVACTFLRQEDCSNFVRLPPAACIHCN